jgi:hypothetical protein
MEALKIATLNINGIMNLGVGEVTEVKPTTF